MANNPVIIAEIVGFGVFFWLALYLLVRPAVRSTLIALSVAGLLGQAAYFLVAALTDTTADPIRFVALERWTWWTSVLPLAIWFHLSSLIARPIRQPAHAQTLLPRRAAIAYVAALLIITVDAVSNLFNTYDATPVLVHPGPAYPIYLLFQIVMTGGALFHFLRARMALTALPANGERALRRQLALLIAGSAVFIAGAVWLGSDYLLGLALSPIPGYMCLFAAVGLLGYGVAHYGMLLDGRNIQRDFFYTFSGVALMNLLYVSLVVLATDVATSGVLALVTLVTLTHTAFDSGRRLLDRLFFSSDEQAARAEAREFATALGTDPVAAPDTFAPAETPEAPDSIVESSAPDDADRRKTFKSDVRKALTGLKSPPRLVNSPLLALATVEQQLAGQAIADNRLNRVSALRELLIAQIEGLRPDSGDGPKVGEAWRFYNVLYYPYVRELSRKGALAEARRLRAERLRNGLRQPGELEQVLEWLADVDEDTFYKWQRRASDTIAEALFEQEQRVSAM